MKILRDFQGRAIRLTQERLTHILEHPEMAGMEQAIEEALVRPERVVESFSDPQARLYYRFYVGTRVGDSDEDAFLLTACLTDTIKKGVQLWPKEG